MRTFLVLLLIVVIIGVGVGFYRGWFSFSSAGGLQSEELKLGLNVDNAKIKSDADAARESARDLKDNVKKTVEGARQDETVRGKITSVNGKELTVMQEGDQAVTIGLNTKAEVRIGQREATQADLRVGDQVQVTCVVENGRRTARSINVERSS